MPTPAHVDNRPACAGVDPELFFDDDRQEVALAVCHGCSGRARCLAYALDNEEFGVWGGTTSQMRLTMRGRLPGSPEERQVVWLIRERVERGDPIPDVAAALGVTPRTLFRWLAQARAA